MPQPDRHIHVVIFNLTWDEEEQQWKAVKFRPIMDLRKFFDRMLRRRAGGGNGRSRLRDRDRSSRRTRKGNLKYYSWDIKGIPDPLLAKRSRRSRGDRAAGAGDRRRAQEEGSRMPRIELSPVEKDRLGGTSRRQKRDDLTLAECREYWDSRRTDDGGKRRRRDDPAGEAGLNPRPENRLAAAVSFSMRHHFEKEAALPVEELVDHRPGARAWAAPAGGRRAGAEAAGRHHRREGRPAAGHHRGVAGRGTGPGRLRPGRPRHGGTRSASRTGWPASCSAARGSLTANGRRRSGCCAAPTGSS